MSQASTFADLLLKALLPLAQAPPPSAASLRQSLTPASYSFDPVDPAVSRALSAAWADSTLKVYNQGIATFVSWCGAHSVPQADRLPASEALLCSIAASAAGSRSASTIRNHLSGIRALHIFHNLPYQGSIRLDYVVRGAANLTPASSKRDPRAPITVNFLCLLAFHFLSHISSRLCMPRRGDHHVLVPSPARRTSPSRTWRNILSDVCLIYAQ
jgi:hypothetical protein